MIYYPNCKINIGLNIIEKRDDGFHNIETMFYPVFLEDILEINLSKDKHSTITTTGLDIGNCPNEDNLCYKAYLILKKDYPQIGNVNIHLHKNIPIGSGLGGGSSDCAFTIRMLNDMFSLSLSLTDMEKYAQQLGSDCAFFLYNIPTFAFEKGDSFSSTTLSLKGKTILIVKDDTIINTKDAYKEVQVGKSEINLLNTLEKFPISSWKNFIKNDFEKPIFNMYPHLEKIKEELYSLGALYAQMSGSGSAFYGIFDREITKEEINLLPYSFVEQQILK
ncbi:MAG: 4-(cytidine 5'-diphospho)-2-C-methyl-D-erythritol kinase [Bacteroidales bacterium]|jgi:4-diphosphocytidyl-2-C-methyl-D-erythritol kinase|nr:4-(cytidine 5'-diphospho)-2-C-methyl-D-erythritol kinase [Bacteroidales bacterium]